MPALRCCLKVVSMGISLPPATGSCLVKVCNRPKGQLTACGWAVGSLPQRLAQGTGTHSHGSPELFRGLLSP